MKAAKYLQKLGLAAACFYFDVLAPRNPGYPQNAFPGHVLDPAGKQDIQRHVIVHEPANSAPKKHVAAAHEVILVALTKRKFPLDNAMTI